jgi:hypothetical protein
MSDRWSGEAAHLAASGRETAHVFSGTIAHPLVLILLSPFER